MAHRKTVKLKSPPLMAVHIKSLQQREQPKSSRREDESSKNVGGSLKRVHSPRESISQNGLR